MDNSKITDALAKLDPNNNDHWTADGLPRLDSLKIMTGNPGLTRDMVQAAAPDFVRPTGTAQGPAQAATSDPVQGSSPTDDNAPQAGPTGPSSTDDTLPTMLNPTVAVEGGEDAEVLRAQLGDLRLEYDAISTGILRARQRQAELQNEMDAVHNRLVELEKITPQDAISGYLAAQRVELEERAKRIRAVADTGHSLNEVAKAISPSPLDMALRGRRTRR
jgi:hypothetical protein